MRNVRRPRQIKLAAIAAAVAITPLLSSCSLAGFDYATDRPNQIVNGGAGTSGNIHVRAARIVAPADGVGTFVSTLVTGQRGEAATFVGLSGIITGQVEPITVENGKRWNMFSDGGVRVAGDFAAGDVIPVTLTFTSGSEIRNIEVNAIVVTQCHDYADVAGGKIVKAAAVASGAEAYDCAYAQADLPTHE